MNKEGLKIKITKGYEEKLVIWAKYPGTLQRDYISIAETKILASNVKLKVEISVDDNKLVNYGKVYVFSDKLMKFNKLVKFNFNGLFGAEDIPEGVSEDGLPDKIVEAAKRLLDIAIKILI